MTDSNNDQKLLWMGDCEGYTFPKQMEIDAAMRQAGRQNFSINYYSPSMFILSYSTRTVSFAQIEKFLDGLSLCAYNPWVNIHVHNHVDQFFVQITIEEYTAVTKHQYEMYHSGD